MEEISYCGFYCSNCPIFKATINNDLESLKKLLKNDSIDSINYGCLGCKSNLVNKMCDSCYIKSCCISKNISNCGECDKFSCDYVKKYLSKDSIERLLKIRKIKDEEDY